MFARVLLYITRGMIHSPNLFLAVNMSSGAFKFLLSLPSPSVLADSSGIAGCSPLGLFEYNCRLLNGQVLKLK